MADQQPDGVTVTEHGHPLYGLTVPVADLPRYRLAPPPDPDERAARKEMRVSGRQA